MNYKKLSFLVMMALYGHLCLGQAPVSDQEIPPPVSNPCFPGAYYRKAVSSFDDWTGILGVVTLGYPKVDENRLDAKTNQPLDNFSVYMGGNADGKHELDAGLTWEFSTDATGKRSSRRNSWRPFWRAGSWNSAPDKPEFTWKPGDKVQMAVRIIAPEKLRMTIADVNHPEKKFEIDYDVPGFTYDVKRQFKRVNAIDQVHNEGKPVQATTAKVTGAEWFSTTLYRGVNAKKLPMNKSRFTDMRCNDASHIIVTETNNEIGAERIDILGNP